MLESTTDSNIFEVLVLLGRTDPLTISALTSFGF